MGRMYSVTVSGEVETTAFDFFELLAATGVPVVLHNFNVSQSTEVGDAQEEMMQVLLKRGVGSVTSGSGGATPTPVPRDKNDAAAVTTIETFNTTKLVVGSGSLVNLEKISFNIRAGFDRWWTPETRPIVRPGDRLIAELVSAPLDSTSFDMTLIFEEV